ncbi:MAG: glucose-6-phosphate dehydrogenase [Actinomycetota bacterium]|nr:glucose-6-phosphate dehydrogenase [Actinomycetota bacterium]
MASSPTTPTTPKQRPAKPRTPKSGSPKPRTAARSQRAVTAKKPARGQRQTLLILGASGDLTGRLLLPGVGGLLASHRGEDMFLLGAGMESWTQARWKARVRDSFATENAKGARITAVLADTEYVQADVTDPDALKALLDKVIGPVAIYFALPPAIAERACAALTKIELPADTRLVLEKPFGVDAPSARRLNTVLSRLVPEEHIFRVDHFLGKSTVLNLLGVRFANRLFEPVLNSEHVQRVEIVFDEDLGLEGRAGYYDNAGALVDMIQSHLLQVLAVMTMDAPPTLDAADIRDRKAEILRATRLWGDDPLTAGRRARYTAGTVGRRKLNSYASSPGVDPQRKTETLAEIALEVNTWRWAGVPFVLRSGKALGTQRKELCVTFKLAPRIPDGFTGKAQPEELRIGLDPAFMRLSLNVNGPGDPLQIDPVEVEVDFGPGELSPYGEVLLNVLDDDPALSVRGDSAVDCWRIVQPVLNAWRANEVPLDSYPAGSSGPRKWK